MKPIPTIEELTAIAKSDARHVFPWYTDFQITASIAAPLFAAIAERDAEIERLRRLMAEAYDFAEALWNDPFSMQHDEAKCVPAIMGRLNIVQRKGTTEPEPAKPETFEAEDFTVADPYTRVFQLLGAENGPPAIQQSVIDEAKQIVRVKPWTLPLPPEGSQWHRIDWTEKMLPEGWRPLLLGEINTQEDYGRNTSTGEFWLLFKTIPAKAEHTHLRTRRPLPEPQTWVDLGPEDCPPGSVFRLSDKPTRHWSNCSYVTKEGARFSEDFISFEDMNKECFQINRSIPLAGKWDLNAWEDCKKLKI